MPGLCVTCKHKHVLFFQRPHCCTVTHHDDLRNKERLSILLAVSSFNFCFSEHHSWFCKGSSVVLFKDIGLASLLKGKRWDDKLSFPQWNLYDFSKVLICWDAKIINNVVWIWGRSWWGFGGWEHATWFLFSSFF